MLSSKDNEFRNGFRFLKGDQYFENIVISLPLYDTLRPGLLNLYSGHAPSVGDENSYAPFH